MSERKDKRLAPVGRPDVRPQAKGYGDAGASQVRRALKGWVAQSGSPQEDIDIHNYTLRQRARMLYMSAPIATSAIKTNRTNVIGRGLWLKSRINREVLGLSEEAARAWQRRTESEFRMWAADKKNCDAIGVSNFYAMQGVAFAAMLLSGDVFALICHEKPTARCPYGLRLRLIEADLISTPNTSGGGVYTVGVNFTQGKTKEGNPIYDGVEVDKATGAIVAYHIRNKYPFELTGEPVKWQRVEAYGRLTGLPNILHLMDAERPQQYRGVTYLAQVIEPLLQVRRYTESELTAAIVESFFTAFIKTEADPTRMPMNEVGDPAGELGEDMPIIKTPNEYEMGPGTINMLKPGESVEFGDPKRPSSGFENFTGELAKQVGAALEIPADLLLKAFNASYSASRAALLESWKAFKMRREWFIDDFCKPIYEIWLSEAVASERISAPGFFGDARIRAAWLGSEWTGPSQGQLDPVKEIQAEQLACENGFSTREQSTVRLNGGSFEANAEQLRGENALLKGAELQASGARAAAPKASASALDALAQMLLPAIKKAIQEEGKYNAEE